MSVLSSWWAHGSSADHRDFKHNALRYFVHTQNLSEITQARTHTTRGFLNLVSVLILKEELLVVVLLWKLREVAHLEHAVVAQHAIHRGIIEDWHIVISWTKCVPTALSKPNVALAHFAALQATDVSLHNNLCKLPAMHTQQHACKDTMCEHLYILVYQFFFKLLSGRINKISW